MDTSSALRSSYLCLAGGGLWSYDRRLGAICSVAGSIALCNPEEKVLKTGLNTHVRVRGITGSITCGTGWDVPLQTLVREDLVNRFNDQHSEEELSITGVPGQCYTAWEVDRYGNGAGCVSPHLPELWAWQGSRHWQPSMDSTQVQSVFSQMLRLVGGSIQGWILSQSYNFCHLYS